MEFSKIKNELWEVGFDDFYQAGSTSKFHKMNIVAISKKLNMQYWICVDGGYCCKDEFYISYRPLDDIRAKSERIECKNQSEVVAELRKISEQIKAA